MTNTPIYAIRSFMYNETLGVLHGYDRHQIILDGTNIAGCTSTNHKAPDEECTCGFHGYDDTTESAVLPYQTNITGIVRLSGKTITDDDCIRAEHMNLVALAWPGITPAETAAIRTNYPSVKLFDTVTAMREQFPTTPIPRPAIPPLRHAQIPAPAHRIIRRTLTAAAIAAAVIVVFAALVAIAATPAQLGLGLTIVALGAAILLVAHHQPPRTVRYPHATASAKTTPSPTDILTGRYWFGVEALMPPVVSSPAVVPAGVTVVSPDAALGMAAQ